MNSEEKKVNSKPHMAGPRGRGGAGEKPKNLKSALRKMIKYLHRFVPLIVIALVLSSLSSVFSIIGPNKLSDLTDKISKGLVINERNLKLVSQGISNKLEEKRIQKISKDIICIDLNSEVVREILLSDDISHDDKMKFQEVMNTINDQNMISQITSLPKAIQRIVFKDSSYQGKIISKDDQIKYLSLIAQIKDEKEAVKTVRHIPSSIQDIFLPTFTVQKKKITTSDQLQFLEMMSKVEDFENPTKIYKELDRLPQSIYDLIKPNMDFQYIKGLSLVLLILYLISASFNFIQGFIMAIVSNHFAQELRTKISIKINRLPLKYFDQNSYGDILSRVTNDVDTIGFSMYQSLGSLVGAITLFIGSIIMMFGTNWIMAVTAILSSLLGFILMFVILGKSQKYFMARQVELGKLNGHIEEIYSSHHVVKAYNGERESSLKFDELNDRVYECNRKSQFLSGLMQPIMAFIGNFSYVAVCIVGALLVINNHITFGVIVAFMIYVRLFTTPLSQIAQGMTQLQTTAAASERVFEFLEEGEMEEESHLTKVLTNQEAKGNIEFSHVKFGYNEDKIVIKDFNCKVKKGQKIAIVGPTGAGKTTMVNLLMKFYNINSGDIKIDGISIKELTRENVHQLFVMVLQDTWLFNGTIRDNIKYNQEEVSDRDIWKALRTVGVDHFVKTLPNDLDYEITDNDSISAGQKQLLTIARGMIENAPFLILDEATSSVDTRTEELVQKAMDKLTEGKTSFIIAHRLSTIKNADIILVMKEGNIIEQGSHSELIKKKGFYADLYNSQFES